MSNMETKNVQVQVKVILWGRLKDYARREGRDLQKIVEQAFEEYLMRREGVVPNPNVGHTVVGALNVTTVGPPRMLPPTADDIRALVNAVVPDAIQPASGKLAMAKADTRLTPLQIARRRESQRGKYEESQDPRDHEDF